MMIWRLDRIFGEVSIGCHRGTGPMITFTLGTLSRSHQISAGKSMATLQWDLFILLESIGNIWNLLESIGNNKDKSCAHFSHFDHPRRQLDCPRIRTTQRLTQMIIIGTPVRRVDSRGCAGSGCWTMLDDETGHAWGSAAKHQNMLESFSISAYVAANVVA